MAITNCRECDARVSTEALSCPHCGVPRPASVPPQVGREAAPSSVGPTRQSVSGQAGPASASSTRRPTQQVVVVANTKSIGLSIVLTVLFGPLGMLYSTIPGALIMGIASVILGAITLGFGLFITWSISIIWGAIATSSYNKALVTGTVIRNEPPSSISQVSGAMATAEPLAMAAKPESRAAVPAETGSIASAQRAAPPEGAGSQNRLPMALTAGLAAVVVMGATLAWFFGSRKDAQPTAAGPKATATVAVTSIAAAVEPPPNRPATADAGQSQMATQDHGRRSAHIERATIRPLRVNADVSFPVVELADKARANDINAYMLKETWGTPDYSMANLKARLNKDVNEGLKSYEYKVPINTPSRLVVDVTVCTGGAGIHCFGSKFDFNLITGGKTVRRWQ